MRHGTALLAWLLCVSASLQAQNRTPWGDAPLERPAASQGKSRLTAAEAAEFEKSSLDRRLKGFAPEVPLSGELNGIWLETAKGNPAPNRGTSLVVDPPDGKIPYRPEGQRRWDATPKMGPPLLANRPEDRASSERCITTDGLMAPNPFYDNLHQIVQAPGYVAILTEMMHEVRIIPIDRRARLGTGVRMYLGGARGYWEGQTLVVETLRGILAGARVEEARQP